MKLVLAFLTTFFFLINVYANDFEDIASKSMRNIIEECREHGAIMAEAKWSKFQKSPSYSSEKYPKEIYKSVVAILQQQCVSVKKISLLRLMKSQMPTKEALELRVDEMIDAEMLIVEKAL